MTCSEEGCKYGQRLSAVVGALTDVRHSKPKQKRSRPGTLSFGMFQSSQPQSASQPGCSPWVLQPCIPGLGRRMYTTDYTENDTLTAVSFSFAAFFLLLLLSPWPATLRLLALFTLDPSPQTVSQSCSCSSISSHRLQRTAWHPTDL